VRAILRKAPPMVAPFVLAVAFAAGCSGPTQRDVRGTILTEDGSPIPGAIFYAEAWDDDGPFAFVMMTTGTAGEVPQSAREASKIAWRPGARVAVAAFATGYAPAVLRNPERAVRTDGVLLALHRAPGAASWNPDIAELAFPFPDTPELQAQAREITYGPLRRAFREAWAARPPGDLPEAQQRKLSLLTRMD